MACQVGQMSELDFARLPREELKRGWRAMRPWWSESNKN